MRGSRRHRAAALTAALAVHVAALAACGNDGDSAAAPAGGGEGDISVWAHQGVARENDALRKIVADFNQSQDRLHVDLRLIPAAEYTRRLLATDHDELPDVLEFDGPTMAHLIFNGKLAPIVPHVSAGTVDNATEAIREQGTARGKLYGLGVYDSGLGLYGNKSLLTAAGVDYPRGLDDPWTAKEFGDALEKLAAEDSDGEVLDIRENDGLATEWGTYGFTPVLWSAGATLIRDNRAEGVLDSDEAVAAFTTFQSWKRFVDPNTGGNAFQDGEVALSWAGHWLYPDYDQALGDDLVVMPLPDFGNGVKSGQGSWAWGISAGTDQSTAAGRFLDFLLNDDSVTAMTDANGAPPGTTSVLATSELYGEGGPLRLFAEQLDKPCGDQDITATCVAVTRPVTAGYPVITAEFSEALSEIFAGKDPKDELSRAARAIDRDYEDNSDYEL